MVDSTFAPDDAMSEDAEVLVVFVEENNNSLLGLDVSGNEDWEAGLSFFGVEGKTKIVEPEGYEAIRDDGTDCSCSRMSYREWLEKKVTGHS